MKNQNQLKNTKQLFSKNKITLINIIFRDELVTSA